MRWTAHLRTSRRSRMCVGHEWWCEFLLRARLAQTYFHFTIEPSKLPATFRERDGEEAGQLLAEPDGLLPQGPEEEGQGEEQEAAGPGATRTSTHTPPNHVLTPHTCRFERSRKPSSPRNCLVLFASLVPHPSRLSSSTRPLLTNSLLPCTPLWAFRAASHHLETHHSERIAYHKRTAPPRTAPPAAPFSFYFTDA